MPGGEIDLDAFAFGDEVELDPTPAPPDARDVSPEFVAAVEAAGEPMQMGLDGEAISHAENTARQADNDARPAREYVRALIYASRSGGEDHIVVIHDTTEGPAALCSCKATRNLARRPQGCWATIDARNVAGIPQPEVA